MTESRFFTPVLIVLTCLTLALNLWGIGPWILENAGPGFANLFYVGLRVAAIVGIPTLLTRFKGFTARQAMAASLLVAAVDQIVFKIVLYYQDSLAHPEVWSNEALRNAAVATFASYVLFSPLLMLMAFAGHFAGKQLGLKKTS